LKRNSVALYFIKLPRNHANLREARGPSGFEQAVFMSLAVGWIALATVASFEHEFKWIPIVAMSAIPLLLGLCAGLFTRRPPDLVGLSFDDITVVADGNTDGPAPRSTRKVRREDIAGWASVDGDIWISGCRVPWDLVRSVSIDEGLKRNTFQIGLSMLESPRRLARLRRFNNIIFLFRLALIAVQAIVIGFLIRGYGLHLDVIAASLNVMTTFIVAQGLYKLPSRTSWTGLPGVLQLAAYSRDPNMNVRDYLAEHTEVTIVD
jgi:hypothetical protein